MQQFCGQTDKLCEQTSCRKRVALCLVTVALSPTGKAVKQSNCGKAHVRHGSKSLFQKQNTGSNFIQGQGVTLRSTVLAHVAIGEKRGVLQGHLIAQ